MPAEDVTERPGMLELVERHRPLLRFDAQEPYLAISAQSIVVNPSNALIRHDGSVLGRVDRDGRGLSLELLADYPSPLTPNAGDRLDEAPDVLADALRMQADPDVARRAYGRAVEDEPWLWLQYFFWEYYNPKHLLGFGRHEGDWELIQIGLDAERTPRVATYAQHKGGAGRAWDEIERERDGDAEYPVVYVAPFSHASYFEARTHWHPGGPDTPDGRGPAYRPRIERFGAWARWPGRWGNSTGVLGGRLGGRSPASPGAQLDRWERPTAFHGQVQRKRPLGAVDGALWRAGRGTYPERPTIERASLRDAVLTGELSVATSPLRRASRIYVTAHDAGEEGQPVLRSTVVRVKGGRGEFELLLPRAPARCLIRASAFNALRQRSEPAREVEVEQS
jgi:hypothetical protein